MGICFPFSQLRTSAIHAASSSPSQPAAQTRLLRGREASASCHSPSQGTFFMPCFLPLLSPFMQSAMDQNSSSLVASVTENNSKAQEEGEISSCFLIQNARFYFPAVLLLVYRLVNLNLGRTEGIQ